MTRQDFQLIADVVRTIEDTDTRHQTALNFAHRLKDTNDNFDMARFVHACEPPTSQGPPCPVRDGLSVSFVLPREEDDDWLFCS